ncbi:MAG: hypothetical protein Q8P74_02170 [bacterium]|nr:hypothetical protein [bacterium]
MIFTIQGLLKENIYVLMRKVGYHFQGRDETKSELTFTHPARGYPRFHIYLKTKKDSLTINLHLDQKKPIYKGAPAHSAEYEGRVIKEEVQRIKQILL